MKIDILGDVHLGRPFQNGVPLHRRGDRERMQWAEFEQKIMNPEGDVHLQIGDLFDKPIVPYSVVFRAAQMYLRAVAANPNVTYVVLRGNHDANKDIEKVTAFMIFTAIVRDKVTVVDEVPVLIKASVFIPWHPITNAEEMVRENCAIIKQAAWAFGHWDIDARQAESSNYIPAILLQSCGITKAFTGHDHVAREMEIDGLPVVCAGSMQPYSHGEDPDGRFYVTRSLAEVILNIDSFKDKHLRVRLEGDEVLDTAVDCLSLQTLRGDSEEESIAVDVDFDAFDVNVLLDQAAATTGLRPDLTETVRSKLQEGRMNDGTAE